MDIVNTIDNNVHIFKMYELEWKQQSAGNMYPIIKERLEEKKLNEEELNYLYKEQKELYDIFHYENSYLSFTNKRKVRFCLKCKMYYIQQFSIVTGVNLTIFKIVHLLNDGV